MSLDAEAREWRREVLALVHAARKSHIGSCLSCIEIFMALERRADFTPDQRADEDRIIVGKGWIAALFYYFLARRQVIPWEDLERYVAGDDGRYLGLLEPNVRGVLMAGGSVGMGLPFGVGVALAKKLQGRPGIVYVVEGDGALQTGIFWESVMLARHHGLDNLRLIVDRNGLQAMGRCEDILDTEPIRNRLEAFGWTVTERDGHDVEALEEALEMRPKGRPTAIIARTVKGKGVSFMENDFTWHYRCPDDDEYDRAVICL